jgi:competence protein ComEC
VALGTASLAMLRPPDVLVSGDGRHVGIVGESAGELLVLRDSKSDFVRDNLTELAGMTGELRQLSDWPGARCSPDFGVLTLRRGGRDWRLLIARSRERISERSLAAACDRADIVIADRWLPGACRPAMLKADRRLLTRTGGLAIDLEARSIRTVAESQGEHGWWRVDGGKPERAGHRPQPASAQSPLSRQ